MNNMFKLVLLSLFLFLQVNFLDAVQPREQRPAVIVVRDHVRAREEGQLAQWRKFFQDLIRAAMLFL